MTNVHTYVYMFVVNRLGKEVTEPIGVCLDLPQFRMIDMFTACTHPSVKDSILDSVANKDDTLRIVIAFGMGLDCPNIRQIIHQVMLNHIYKKLDEQVVMENQLKQLY